MAINVWDPFTALARLDSEFDDLVRRAWSRGGATSGYVPAVEMKTDGGDVLITVELPGVDIDNDVDIEVAEGRLTISGSRQDRSTSQHGKVLVREFRYGGFRRDFALPEGITADQVNATYDAGLLHVRVHNVTRPVQPPRKVQIRSGEPRTVEAHVGDKADRDAKS